MDENIKKTINPYDSNNHADAEVHKASRDNKDKSPDIHSQLKDEMQKDYAKGKKEVTK